MYIIIDITPQTEGSRVVMMLLIVISLAVLPGLLADVLTTVRKRNGNRKKYLQTNNHTYFDMFGCIRLGRLGVRICKTIYIIGRVF